ncbi:MAG: CYTH domain-containing protein [Pelosinus sp.]|nr:CYTH domain-containing protein [Pelosinus sp.]
MQNNTEIELKLQVADPAIWRDLLSSSLWDTWGAAKWQQVMMEAVYFDTPLRTLNEQRIAYRVRREGSKYVATVKSGGSSNGGLHERREWNVEVQSRAGDISVFKDTDIWPTLQEFAGDQPLAPLFATTFKRLTLEISPNAGTVIEIAADQGEILAGEKHSPILELELELKSGEPGSLLKLGAELTREYPLLLEWRSKFYRAMELAGLIEPQPMAEYAAAQAEARKNIQSLLSLQSVFYKNGCDVRQENALLLEMWAELTK